MKSLFFLDSRNDFQRYNNLMQFSWVFESYVVFTGIAMLNFKFIFLDIFA